MKSKYDSKRVNFMDNPLDFKVLVLGSLGFSTKYIAQESSRSHGQVLYRLKKAKVKRADYRNGKSDSATIVIGAAEQSIARQIRKELRHE